MKKLLQLLGFTLLSLSTAFAQRNTINLIVKAGSKDISFVYRLNKQNDTMSVDMGLGETISLIQENDSNIMQAKYTFKTVSSEQRHISLTTDNLVTLRITSSKVIEGIEIYQAPMLERFNCDFTPLVATPRLDFSACPIISEITLNGAEVSDIIFPENPSTMKTFQWSTPLIESSSKKQLTSLDISKCSNLEDLSLQGTSLRTIDVSHCKKIKQLIITGLDTKNYPRILKGGKALKELEKVIISKASFSFDMLPDLNQTQLDNFIISKMYYAHVDKSNYNGMTVDLSHIAYAKGISEKMEETSFTWFYKNDKKWIPIEKSKITTGSKKGIFTFDNSLLNEEGKVTVRARIANAGYPNLNYFKDGLHTYNIPLTNKQELPHTLSFTVSSESPGKDADGEDIEDISLSLVFGAKKANTPIAIDWGNGEKKGYEIPKNDENYTVSATVDLGSTIKIYGDISLFNGTRNYISAIDFRESQNLEIIRLSQNKIASIDLSPLTKLRELQITDNLLGSLDLSNNPNLDELYCGYNQLTTLDLSKVPNLSLLSCNNNQIQKLNFADVPGLKIVTISGNNFGNTIDLSPCKNMRYLDIEDCGLSSIRLATSEIKTLRGKNNRLRQLFFTDQMQKLDHLTYVNLANNLFEACDLNDLISAFSNNDKGETKSKLFVQGNPGAKTFDSELISLWQIDVQGDGTGCSTAKIFDGSTTENGHAYIINSKSARIPFGSSIQKNSDLTIVLEANEGWIPSYCKWNESMINASQEDPSKFPLMIKNNGFISYDFKKETSNQQKPISKWRIKASNSGFEISTPYAHAPYYLYSFDGKLIKKGESDDNGKVYLELIKGSYLLTIAGESIKLIH